MKSKLFSTLAACLLSLGLATAVQAALVDRGGGMIYDTYLDITWLADANYAMTSGHDADGMMNSADTHTWVDQLSYGGFDDWRLPFNPQFDSTCDNTRDVSGYVTDFGFGCTGSEYGHLFYVDLDGTAGSPITSSLDPDVQLFSNIQANVGDEYWASEIVELGWIDHHFHMFDGYQRYYDSSILMYSMVVRDGDVSPVPVPAALWLFGSGLLGLAGFCHKRK